MKLTVVSFDGDSTINDKITFYCELAGGGNNPLTIPGANNRFMDLVGAYPKLTSTRGKLRKLELMASLVSDATPFTKRDLLAGIFDSTDYSGTAKTLIVSDDEDSDKQWKIDCIVLGFEWDKTDQGTYAADITLVTLDDTWEETSETSDVWNITASGQTNSITPSGNKDILPLFEIKPTGARSGAGMGYRSFVQVTNPMSRRFRGFINIANSEASNGLDTSTLVGAGKMQADGDDLRVRVDGERRDRYLQDMNTASTEIWIRLGLKPKILPTLGTAIAGAGAITTIDFEDTPANVKRIGRMPERGQVVIASEYFTYTGKDEDELQLTGVKRSAFGSSAAAHSVADVITWIQHRIWLVYGDTSATAPNSPDASDLQHVFRGDSENDRLDFDEFMTEAKGRGDEWYSQINFREPAGNTATGEPGETTLFTGSAEANSNIPVWADPATFLGQQLRPVRVGDEYVKTAATLLWHFYHEAGMDTVTVTGRKFATSTSYWPRVELWYSKNGTDWEVLWTEAAPGSASTWADFSAGINGVAKALGDTYRHIALVMKGSMPAGTSEQRALVEYSDVVVDLDTTNVPAVSIGAEQGSQYELKNVTLSNDTTGESLRLKRLTITLNQSLVIDCATRQVYLLEDNVILRRYQFTDVIRGRWITLRGDTANVLSFTDVGTGNLTITTKYTGRNN